MKVLCGRDFMSIRAAEDFFTYLKVPLESLHLPNRSCRAQREVIAGTPFFMFRTSREKYLACGGKPLQVPVQFHCFRPSSTVGVIQTDSFCSVAEELDPPPVLPHGPIRTSGQWEHHQRPGH